MIMKSILRILLVSLVSTVVVQAQFSAGLKAGLNMATMVVDDDAGDYGYTPGFQVGGFLH